MSRRDDLLELLRPPAHRGPVIASGAVLFTAGLLLEEQRLDDRLPNGVHLVLVAAATALLLGVALLSPLEGGRPTASQSVLLVCGLVLLEVTQPSERASSSHRNAVALSGPASQYAAARTATPSATSVIIVAIAALRRRAG